MKRSIKLIRNSVLAIVLLALPFMSFAQHGKEHHREQKGERMEEAIPDLTEDQKGKIKDIRLAHMKTVKDKRNVLNEKKARLQTLRSADKPDMKEIDKLIDEMSVIKADISKKEEKTHQDIRALLTDEQRIVFDTKAHKRRERARHKGHH